MATSRFFRFPITRPTLFTRQTKRLYASSPLTPFQRPPPPKSPDGYSRFHNNQKIPFYKSKRFLLFAGTGTVMFGGYYVTHLEQVPISGRYRFMDVTPRQEEAMAMQAYQEVMQQYGRRILPPNHPYSQFVRHVAKRLVHVSGMEGGMNWEFYVVDSPERNAFVLPGGKVFVFTGILPIVQNEGLFSSHYISDNELKGILDGMAAVLGHEISHQLARHSAEKLSFAKVLLAAQITMSLFGIDPSFVFNRMTLNFLMMKPFSRKCETEADDMGLTLMAQACFDPKEAINVWKRMEEAGGADIPQFASTHPSHKNRIEFLSKKLPSALEIQSNSDCSTEMHALSDRFRGSWARW